MSEKLSYEQKLNSVVFEDNPLQYCQAAYEVASEYNDDVCSGVVADRAFYNGHDPELEKRKKDPQVVRSAEYVPAMRTAIETREAAILDRGQEDSLLVRMNLKDEFGEDEGLQDAIADKEAELNEQLRKSGFFFDGLMTWIHASEQQPLSIMKVTQCLKYDWVAKKKSILGRGIEWLYTKFLQGEIPQMAQTKYEWELVEKRPGIDWLDFDEFLYDKGSSRIQDCRYVIHPRYLSWNDCLDEANINGWDKRELDLMRDSGSGDKTSERIAERVDAEIDYDHKKNMKDGKYLICEFLVKTKDDIGRDVYREIVLGNNNFKLYDKPANNLKGIGYPYLRRVAWEKLGCIEGISSVQRVKSLQILFSDVHNAILDAASYGILPPIFVKSTTQFLSEPKWGPLSVNRVDDVDGIKQMEINVGHVELLPALAESYAVKINQELNAPDISQGVRGPEEEEKATKTNLRNQGSLRRLRPLFEGVKKDILTVAEMFIKFNMIDDPEWIILDKVELDVPAFSGVSTPEEEKVAALTLWESTLNNPLYQNPVGLLKQRKFFENVLNKFRIDDVDGWCPTEEELQAVIQIQTLISQNGESQNGSVSSSNNGAGQSGMA
jgi:hypothetical protein